MVDILVNWDVQISYDDDVVIDDDRNNVYSAMRSAMYRWAN